MTHCSRGQTLQLDLEVQIWTSETIPVRKLSFPILDSGLQADRKGGSDINLDSVRSGSFLFV